MLTFFGMDEHDLQDFLRGIDKIRMDLSIQI